MPSRSASAAMAPGLLARGATIGLRISRAEIRALLERALERGKIALDPVQRARARGRASNSAVA